MSSNKHEPCPQLHEMRKLLMFRGFFLMLSVWTVVLVSILSREPYARFPKVEQRAPDGSYTVPHSWHNQIDETQGPAAHGEPVVW